MIYKPDQIELNKAIVYVGQLFKAGKCIEIKPFEMTRSNQQNRALRLYWKLLSQALNNEGCTYMSSRGKELKFTVFKIENDWREMMLEMYGIESTKDLTTEMINEIYDCMNLEYSQNFGIFQEFPSFNSFSNKMDADRG